MLAEKLNMGTEEAERWIVNLIRNASLDAKIDSQKGIVVMGSQALSPYQTIIEKTKNLFNRTQLLAQSSEKKRDTNVNFVFFCLIFFLKIFYLFRLIGVIFKHNNHKQIVELFH
jgi:hypothetical protein